MVTSTMKDYAKNLKIQYDAIYKQASNVTKSIPESLIFEKGKAIASSRNKVLIEANSPAQSAVEDYRDMKRFNGYLMDALKGWMGILPPVSAFAASQAFYTNISKPLINLDKEIQALGREYRDEKDESKKKELLTNIQSKKNQYNNYSKKFASFIEIFSGNKAAIERLTTLQNQIKYAEKELSEAKKSRNAEHISKADENLSKLKAEFEKGEKALGVAFKDVFGKVATNAVTFAAGNLISSTASFIKNTAVLGGVKMKANLGKLFALVITLTANVMDLVSNIAKFVSKGAYKAITFPGTALKALGNTIAKGIEAGRRGLKGYVAKEEIERLAKLEAKLEKSLQGQGLIEPPVKAVTSLKQQISYVPVTEKDAKIKTFTNSKVVERNSHKGINRSKHFRVEMTKTSGDLDHLNLPKGKVAKVQQKLEKTINQGHGNVKVTKGYIIEHAAKVKAQQAATANKGPSK
ncbi:hypothetical protein [Rickettsiales endosymbiont of Stachyamoeba lipophora]|uniref:hypothetical protein n=1 Tax=Rickettsiales endosymbiont of Stachyamoeba lipophora TaxID=2486578 RepID=UPI000F64F61D|nr:hypothetical protein [Rickettsiales endosymbiont of Stachyamoeba lipophora]AZL15235.1 hypothetical protein EF513_01500 [Rickettsiales endosymbiont of Stachyamoeba lipophora]